jgi:hypothetical protein
MPRSVLVLCALMLLAASGCDDEPSPERRTLEGAVALPEDLCSLVPESYTSRWALSDAGHSTDNGEDTSTAECTMTGERAGGVVELTATATMYGDTEDADAEERTDEAIDAACRELAAAPQGTVESDDGICSDTTSGDDEATRGYVLDISPLAGGRGLLRLEMVHHGEAWQSVAPDAVGIAGSILSEIGLG